MNDLLKRRPESEAAIRIRFEQGTVEARPGDSVALALLAAGEFQTSRSPKYRRPRGAYCLRGDCGSCLVRIDGQPNQRACLTPVAAHMRVESQNRLMEAGPDPSGLVDRFLGSSMDHHHFMVRPKLANTIMQSIARGLTGLGTLPERAPDDPSPHRVHTPDVLIIGAGPAGQGAFDVVSRASGCRVLWLDRRPPTTGVAREELLTQTGVFGVYPEEGLVAAMTVRAGLAPIHHTIRPQHVVFATGTTDPTIAIPNNDLPGVVAARGLIQQLRQSRVSLEADAVVVGDGALAKAAAAALGCPVIAPAAVTEVEGSSRVEAVCTADKRHRVSLVALAPRPSPAYELARQGGAAVHWDGGGFAVRRDADGRCDSRGPWVAWVCGGAAGYDEASHDDDPRPAAGDRDPSLFSRAHDTVSRADGERVGTSVLAALGAQAEES